MKKITLSIGLITFLALGILLGIALQTPPNILPSPLLNQAVPAFTLRTLETPTKTVTENLFKGQVSLLNVFATWCLACEHEHAFLMQIKNDIPLYGFLYKDDPVRAKKILRTYGNPYQTVMLDTQGLTAIDWGVYGTPETFLIDKHSVIRYKVIGELTPKEWQSKILPLVHQLQQER